MRSADLALYLRGAWLGEKYASEIRGKYLDARHADYEPRRFAWRNVLLSTMDRDLRVARSQARLSDTVYTALVRQVSLLSQLPTSGAICRAPAGSRLTAYSGLLCVVMSYSGFMFYRFRSRAVLVVVYPGCS